MIAERQDESIAAPWTSAHAADPALLSATTSGPSRHPVVPMSVLLAGASASSPGENVGEHCAVTVVSETQMGELGLVEPGDGVVFVRCGVDRSSLPPYDQPDLHVEFISTHLPYRLVRGFCDDNPQLLPKLADQRGAGNLSIFYMATGQIPHIGVPAAAGGSVT
jgi:hypothetical protein